MSLKDKIEEGLGSYQSPGLREIRKQRLEANADHRTEAGKETAMSGAIVGAVLVGALSASLNPIQTPENIIAASILGGAGGASLVGLPAYEVNMWRTRRDVNQTVEDDVVFNNAYQGWRQEIEEGRVEEVDDFTGLDPIYQNALSLDQMLHFIDEGEFEAAVNVEFDNESNRYERAQRSLLNQYFKEELDADTLVNAYRTDPSFFGPRFSPSNALKLIRGLADEQDESITRVWEHTTLRETAVYDELVSHGREKINNREEGVGLVIDAARELAYHLEDREKMGEVARMYVDAGMSEKARNMTAYNRRDIDTPSQEPRDGEVKALPATAPGTTFDG